MISGFDSKLVALIESHPSTLVGTCDKALVPCIARAFGARVLGGSSGFEMLVSRWPGSQTIGNLELSDRIAVTFTSPETFEAYQVKGRARVLGDCDADDMELSSAYTAAVRARVVALGELPELVKITFSPRGLFKIRVDAETVFLQTPGKNAGARL